MRVVTTSAALVLAAALFGCARAPDIRPSGAITAAVHVTSPVVAVTPVAAALTPGDQALSLTRPSRPHRPPFGYKVGVDYHAYGSDFLETSFITQYHLPGIRDTVRAQLQGMADAGASLIFTRIWFVTEPGTTDFGETWRATFPMSDQEQANLRAYAQDVAATVGIHGNALRLDLCTLWLGAADYNRGTPDTGLGWTPISAAEFTRRVELTTDKLLAAVTDIVRPDGIRLVDSIFLEGEVMIGAKANQDWFLLTHYPRFVQVVQQAGFKASLYFGTTGDSAFILQDDEVDPEYPILNGHGSMWWMYRSLKFMVDNHLPIPQRIDFSFYIPDPDPENAPFEQLVRRVLDDADVVFPSLGVPTSYGVAETHYFLDPTKRRALGLAFVHEVERSPRLDRVQFWTTPDGAGPGIGVGYPFAISDYLP